MRYDLIKRGLDLLVSGVGIVVSAPLMALIAALIKLDSEGEVFFRQERVGIGGQSFRIMKFRTMVAGAEQLGRKITESGDLRVTGVGRLLRKSKLDEIPQLFNVWYGEMSLVGPRPEVPKYVTLFAADYAQILRVRPGITDEASIAYRNEEEVLAAAADAEREYVEVVLPRKIALNRRYLEDMSLTADLSILLRTAWKVVAG